MGHMPLWIGCVVLSLLPLGGRGAAVATDAASTPALVRQLAPLSVRGTNYYPSRTPWGAFWTSTTLETLDADFAIAESLNMNAVRTFLNWTESMRESGLIDVSGMPTQLYLTRFDQLLAVANKHGLRVVVCFDFDLEALGKHHPPDATWRDVMRAFVVPHSGDGRILMWDLRNEPDAQDWNKEISDHLRQAVAYIKELDPNHLTTIGLTYHIEGLPGVGFPDVVQYHEYSPKSELVAQGWKRIASSIRTMREKGGNRPVLIGEFGSSSASDPVHGAGPDWINGGGKETRTDTEAEQAERYAMIFKGAEEMQIVGTMNWCLHEFSRERTGWLTPNESMMGLVRPDGTLKPAAVLTRDTYGRWAKLERERGN